MSNELADRFERDLAATEETQKRASIARRQCAALDVDWADVLSAYRKGSNRDPKRVVRFVESNGY